MDIDLTALALIAKNAALLAGEEIMKIYETGDFSVESKSDFSPLTRADKMAHQKIVALLAKTNIPILSEEGQEIPYAERSKWPVFWMVDPLDGTKEFIKKNGEFTVNIALIKNKTPVLGVVYPPVLGELYWAIKDKGAFKECQGKSIKLTTSKRQLNESGLKVIASRSHLNEDTATYISKLDNATLISKGSSLKFIWVATGQADIYPRFAPTMEWDTAAADILVSEAGGQVTLEDKKTNLFYNKTNLFNPYFIVLPFQNKKAHTKNINCNTPQKLDR